jgi:5-formyltetrahydrofolate cyclo-ligase
MLTLRSSRSPEELDALSARIMSRLLELQEIRNAGVISIYLHIGSEVRTLNVLHWLLSHDKTVIVPITDKANRRLIFSQIEFPERELMEGTFGILEPKPEYRKPFPLEEADVIIVPGVAWDLRGYRLGYGAGYYDRSITSLHSSMSKIGLSYELQIVEHIPNNRFDRRVDKLVTEQRVINTSQDEKRDANCTCVQ